MIDRITYYQTTFGREWRAHCECCATVFAVWDDDDIADHVETCECQNTNHQHQHRKANR